MDICDWGEVDDEDGGAADDGARGFGGGGGGTARWEEENFGMAAVRGWACVWRGAPLEGAGGGECSVVDGRKFENRLQRDGEGSVVERDGKILVMAQLSACIYPA